MRGRACSPLARGWSGRCCSAAVPSGWKCYRLNKVHLEAFPAFIVTVFACGGRSGAGPGAGPGPGWGGAAGEPPPVSSARPAPAARASMAAERASERELRFYRRLPKAVRGGGRARSVLRRQRAAGGQTDRATGAAAGPQFLPNARFLRAFPHRKVHSGVCLSRLFTDLSD